MQENKKITILGGLPLHIILYRDDRSRGQILSPWPGDGAGSGVGLSYQPASLWSRRADTKTRRQSQLHPPVRD